ncbi:MAG TPA: metallophosphoesterase [Draconibacterium sp.]|nr:metallophosphoesterase [Draconibacterium sp.]
MKRRSFIGTTIISGLGLPVFSFAGEKSTQANPEIRNVFSMDKNSVQIFTNAEIKPTRIFQITDTHLALEDGREAPFKKYSQRMGNAYKINKHFETGEDTTCAESFEQALQRAKEQKADFLALTGDIFSFPSEAAIEWVLQKLKETAIPFGYIAGNHDWHYEGMPGSSFQLRKTWANERLKSMYQGNNYLFAAYDINGIRMVLIDNSTYEIEREQLDFFRQQIKSGLPLVLFMHIPLYMPGRSMGYGCANPQWGEQTDKNFEIEQREKWRKGGHTPTTFSFYEEVFNAQNLLAIFAGHTHRAALDVKNNIPQVVSGHNATGYFADIVLAKRS